MLGIIFYGFIGGLIASSIIGVIKKVFKRVASKQKVQPKRTMLQNDADELITTILPVINSKK